MDDALDQEQMENAVNAITARGETVNLDTIRSELGVVSYGGIVPLLQEWRIKKALTSDGAPGQLWETLLGSLRDLSDDVDAVAAAIEARWAERAAAESSSMSAALALAQDESQKAEAQVRDLRERIEPLEAEAKRALELSDKFALLEADIADMRTKSDAAEAEKGALAGQVKAAEGQVAGAQIAARKSQASQAEAQHRADTEQEARKQADQAREVAEAAIADAKGKARDALDRLETQTEEMNGVRADLEERNRLEEEATLEAEREAERQMAEGDWLLGSEDWPELPRQLAIATARMAALRAENAQMQERLKDTKHALDQAHKLIALRLTERQPTIIQNQIPMMGGDAGVGGMDMPQVSRAAGGGGRVEVIRRK